MRKTIDVFEELPLEIGKTYQVRGQDDWNEYKTKLIPKFFTINKMQEHKGKFYNIFGDYNCYIDLPNCLINEDKLIKEKVKIGYRHTYCNKERSEEWKSDVNAVEQKSTKV